MMSHPTSAPHQLFTNMDTRYRPGAQGRKDFRQPDEQPLAFNPFGLLHGLDHPLMGDHPLTAFVEVLCMDMPPAISCLP